MLILILILQLITIGIIVYPLIPRKIVQQTKSVESIKERSKRIGKILCEFCGDELPFNAIRTKDGHWACPKCKVTVLKQLA